MTDNLQLQRAVLEELDWEPSVDAARIGVAASDDVVTLTGYVESYGQKMAAERAAKRIKGLKAIANDIEVRVPSSKQRSDDELAAAVLHTLQWTAAVPDDRILVTVRNGWITLEGEVDWHFQREAARRAVLGLNGVNGVANQLTVKPRFQPDEIEEKIAAAFRRSGEVEADRISVVAQGDKVILNGHVSSWAQADRAIQAVWSAPGVAQVVNHLIVST